MNRTFKYAVAAGVAGILSLGLAAPSQARHGRNAAAAIGFGAGALVGIAAANANNGGYYGRGYGPRYGYAEPGYGYAPAYAYDRDDAPGYGAYAYEPGGPAGGGSSCAMEGGYGKGTDYANCY